MKEPQTAADPRPLEFECRSSQEYFDLCARARAGELMMHQIYAGTKYGVLWRVLVVYLKPYSPQLELL